ncbi:MAG: HD domain-containing protein [Planctomycetales bacterium]|nr:HD domain-containing protein [Planctomycetales bacterium]
MSQFHRDSLIHDPIHGYIPFTSPNHRDRIAERDIIDHPWVQRLRQIHQLQTAWWVFPSAEHTRFQHVLGAMHLGSRVAARLYESLAEVCGGDGGMPSRGYVETLLRMAGLLHDVGHGPFGHFFDAHFLSHFNETHETLGASIIEQELGPMLRELRGNPHSRLNDDEQLDPKQVAWLIQRPRDSPDSGEATQPRWLKMLRSLLSGIYTIDNMDFVLRDAYMSGYSQRSFDLDRLLHYTEFTPHGLTIHDRGMEALLRFMATRAELFRTIYFHRTVRAIDLTLKDLFADSRDYLFPGSPREHLDEYQHFTEFSLLVDVVRWAKSEDAGRRELGHRWQQLIERKLPWIMVCQRNLVFQEGDAERASIFSQAEWVEQSLRRELSGELPNEPLRVDIARHIYRPNTRGPAEHQNYLYDSAQQRTRPLVDHQLFRELPVSHRICRVYAQRTEISPQIARALDGLLGTRGLDDVTNM